MERKDEAGAEPARACCKGTGKASVGRASAGALAIGASAIGALSVGALAVGVLAVGRFRLRDGRVKRLEIDELIVRRLTILEGPDTQR
jgi:hypothetical protein